MKPKKKNKNIKSIYDYYFFVIIYCIFFTLHINIILKLFIIRIMYYEIEHNIAQQKETNTKCLC